MIRHEINVVVYVDEEEYKAFSANRPATTGSGLVMRLDTAYGSWEQIEEIIGQVIAPERERVYYLSAVGQLGMDSIRLLDELREKAEKVEWFLGTEALRADAARKLKGRGLTDMVRVSSY